MSDPLFTEENFHLALRRRAAAIAALKAETQKRKTIKARLDVCEQALIDIWRWTNDGYPSLELLLPILNASAAEANVLRALDELEAVRS